MQHQHYIRANSDCWASAELQHLAGLKIKKIKQRRPGIIHIIDLAQFPETPHMTPYTSFCIRTTGRHDCNVNTLMP